jgi:hypothetical protein
MPISWRSSRDAFEQILPRHRLDPEAIDDVERAWASFGEILQLEIDGIEEAAEWGTWSWNEELPAITFGRLLTVKDYDSSDRTDPYWQPQYWRIDLEIYFAPHPNLASVEGDLCSAGPEVCALVSVPGEPCGPLGSQHRQVTKAHAKRSDGELSPCGAGSKFRNGTNSAHALFQSLMIAGYFRPQAVSNSTNLSRAASSVGAV